MPITVNDEPLPEEDLEAFGRQLAEAMARQGQRPDPVDLRRRSIDSLLSHKLLEQEARRLGQPIEEDAIQVEYRRILENQHIHIDRQAGLTEELRERIVSRIRMDLLRNSVMEGVAEVSEAEAEAEAHQHPEWLTRPREIECSHILKSVRPPATSEKARSSLEEVKGQLDRGARFEKMAEKHSDCRQSPGGSLGRIHEGMMVERFEQVVFALGEGEVSKVFETEFGWHIARVERIHPPVLEKFKKHKKRIQRELTMRRRDGALQELVDRLRKQATITGLEGEAPEENP